MKALHIRRITQMLFCLCSAHAVAQAFAAGVCKAAFIAINQQVHKQRCKAPCQTKDYMQAPKDASKFQTCGAGATR
jgi:hypothetical protein